MDKLDLEGVESSYIGNHFGSLFYSLVRIEQPELVVELGTYLGYSALHIAAALRDNKHVESEFHMIDLWDRYKYRHCSAEKATEIFRRNEFLNLENATLRFITKDALEIASDYRDETIDFLHIDISNDGAILQRCLEIWHAKLKVQCTLLLEGGSRERDSIDWMQKFSKTPIQSFLQSEWFSQHYQAVVMQPFPSLTIAQRIK